MSQLEPDSVLQQRYRVVRLIGQGGMGAVYEAIDERLGNRVALKQLLLAGEYLSRAFTREARILANLSHPALPNVMDHFTDAMGQFLVMQYIPGDNLDGLLVARGAPFPLDQVLNWADQLLDALAYLHTLDPPVIHRDIKPQNLKLRSSGQVVLLDFGLAKGSVGQVTQVTSGKSVMGHSPGFAPPEQLDGTGTGPRSDLYSLGATLHRLLTNAAPVEAFTRLRAEVRQRPDPLRPAHELNPLVPEAVSVVIAGALALEMDDRPADAPAFRAALKAAAHPPAVVVDSQTAIEPLGGAVEEAKLQPRGPVRDEVLRPDVQPIQGLATPLPAPVPRSSRRLRPWLWLGPLIGLVVLLGFVLTRFWSPFTSSGTAVVAVPTLPQSLVNTPSAEGTTGPTATPNAVLAVTVTRPPQPTLSPTTFAPTTATPDQSTPSSVATQAPTAGSALALSPANAGQIAQLARFGKGTLIEAVPAPDGQLLAVASALGVYLYDVETLREVRFIETRRAVHSIAFSPDGALFAAGLDDATVRLWRSDDGVLVHTLKGHTRGVQTVSFAPDGQTLASGANDNTVRLWRVADGALLHRLEGHLSGVTGVAFAPDGQTLASGSFDYTLRLWRVADGVLLRKLEGHTNGVLSLAFAPDGRMLASGSWDTTIRFWRVTDGAPIRTLTGHTAAVQRVRFAPDGQTLASGGWDNTVRLWQATNGSPLRTLQGHNSIVLSVAFDASGDTLTTSSWDDTVRIWRVADGTQLGSMSEHASAVLQVAFAPGGQVLASASDDSTITLRRVADGTVLHVLKGHNGIVKSVAFAPDGQTLASGADDDTVQIWRVADGVALRTLTGHTDNVRGVAFAPDGQTLASGSDDHTVRLWNVADGALLLTLTGHGDDVRGVAFAPDGQTVASASDDDTVRLWRVADGMLLRTLTGHTNNVPSVAFAPDGQTLASGSDDNAVRIWRVMDGALLQTLEGHTDAVASVAFSPDGTLLASGSVDTTLRLWRVTDGTSLRTLENHTITIMSTSFGDDGLTLATGSYDGTVRLWGLSR